MTDPEDGSLGSPDPMRGHEAAATTDRHLADGGASIRVTSRHNPRFREALGLRDARMRRELGLLLVDGAREIARALAAGVTLREAWVARERVRGEEALAALAAVEATGVPVIEASPELLERLAYGERDDGIVAVVATPPASLDALSLPTEPLIGVVESVEKPGNLGAILRSADGAGVDAVIVADPTSDPWNPNAIRASLGTVFVIPLAVTSASEALAYLTRRSIRVVGADPEGDLPYHEADLRGPVAIVVGAEAAGLTPVWRSETTQRVRIPMHGLADSLNVSASAAVLFYEARRQRGEPARASRPRGGGRAVSRRG